jgi:hypothetical protein
MDFDDMPDSYFAFLSNQKKLAESDKINGAMRDLGVRGSGTQAQEKKKVRSRASQPNLSGTKPPSVPSLPSIQQRSSTHPASNNFTPAHGSGPGRSPTKPPSRPMMGKSPTSRPPGGITSGPHAMPPGSSFGFSIASQPAPMPQPRSNALVFVLIAILLGAIGVLAYLVLTK